MFAKAIALLAAISLTVLQPALMACACVGCGAGHGMHATTANDDAAPTKSCCNTRPGERSCCGSTDGCPCGAQHRPATGDSDPASSSSCRCLAQAPPRVVTTTVSSPDHSAAAHALAAPVAILPATTLPLRSGLVAHPHDLPPPPGGLRVHALYSVWLI